MTLVHPPDRIRDHLVDDSLGRLLFTDDSRGFAHEERASVVHGLIVDFIHVLKVVLHRDDTFAGEILDLLCPVLFPVLNIGVVAHPERSALSKPFSDDPEQVIRGG